MNVGGVGHLEGMSVEECLGHLEREPLGRLCVLVDGIPKAFPVNYRLGVGPDRELTIMIATHRGSVMEVADGVVSFEIDGIDKHDTSGWSVMAANRGTTPVDQRRRLDVAGARGRRSHWP
jgi:nitroimidazol reductase NimA-like FMN-containing flavoprotein (pyridoxamine 5'-phosphate oxidase superfamily)